MIGKVPPELLDRFVLGRTGAVDDRVIQGPAFGEDTGAIQLDDGILVVSTDPLSLAVDRLGTLGVAVACNDVAASGATPAWLTSSIFLADDDPAQLDELTAQLHSAAQSMGVSIVSGHSEYMPVLERPMLVLTAFGCTDRYIPTGGAQPGDHIVMTKTAATEGTAILASDFGEDLDVERETIERAMAYYDELSVMPEAMVLSSYASAMHDPTEGGLLNGLYELAAASEVGLEIDGDTIPISAVTAELCSAAGVDPLRIFSSGVLLATIPETHLEAAIDELSDIGVDGTVIGRVVGGPRPTVRVDETVIDAPIRDEMYRMWE